MLFIQPCINVDNFSTQVKHEEYVNPCITKLYSEGFNDDKVLNLEPFIYDKTITQIDVKRVFINSNSTFTDFIDDDLDIVSKLIFKKSFKVKAKIKAISKFSPKIIID